ncbi:MAG: radical SAM family heme chaperone HemW [Candidatus Auribacter fodinae]|uniref:Heme chaperone HemW n=1 Tax=Candidatus Auribacter fodinae TaxID=2093366 RepID=A0A3A4QQZ3_9BACT|nr:MAG: radical SAM family heme chaperone HemW [Candidatus Auribacter fodinae]
MDNSGIYIHVPFCIRKCLYCGFFSVPLNNELMSKYCSALKKELQFRADSAQGYTFTSLYLGGGTPSLLPFKELTNIINLCMNLYHFDNQAEITIEANPSSLSDMKIQQLAELPINRISLGIQSCDDNILKAIGRPHCTHDSYHIYEQLRKTGFKNISIDAIFALPGQTMNQWKDSLQKILSLRPEHISLYCFTYDPGSEMYHRYKKGELPEPDELKESEMYKIAIETVRNGGYIHYEISNFALQGLESRHNMIYWKNKPYWGFGPSAFSFVDGYRFSAPASIMEYIKKCDANIDELYHDREKLEEERSLHETAALNMRLLKEGIYIPELENRYPGLSPYQILRDALGILLEEEMIQKIDNQRFCLTDKGILFADYVSSQLI